jgi:hypothetical protein
MLNPTVDRCNIIRSEMNRANKLYGLKEELADTFQFKDIFSYSWTAFEAYATNKYNLPGVEDRIKAFCIDHQEDYEANYNNFNKEFKIYLVQLSACQIIDMRPGHTKDKPKQIRNIKKLHDVMSVIFQVRCNLTHGGKDVEKADDAHITKCAAIVFFNLLETYLMKEHFIG